MYVNELARSNPPSAADLIEYTMSLRPRQVECSEEYATLVVAALQLVAHAHQVPFDFVRNDLIVLPGVQLEFAEPAHQGVPVEPVSEEHKGAIRTFLMSAPTSLSVESLRDLIKYSLLPDVTMKVEALYEPTPAGGMATTLFLAGTLFAAFAASVWVSMCP